MAEDVTGSGHGLPTTHWSEIEAAGNPSSPVGSRALTDILVRYRPALLAHVRGKFSLSPEDAEDMVQGFIQKKVLQHNLFATADRARGRFRTYLFSVLDRFVISELRRDQAFKRKAGTEAIPLEYVDEWELPATNPAEETSIATDVGWTQVAVAGALLNMRNECVKNQRLAIWEIFDGRTLRPEMGDSEEIPYEDLIQRYNLDSPATAFNILKSGKRMFERHLRQVVAEYTSDDAEVEEELVTLRRRLRAPERKSARRSRVR